MKLEIQNIIYITIGVLLLLFIGAFIYGLWKGSHKERLEPFTQADVPASTNTGIGESQPAPVNQPDSGYYPDDGLQPLVLVNNQEWPIVYWGCLATGTISNWVTVNHIRRRVYPCEPRVYTSYSDILEALAMQQVDCGFVREYLLLQAKPSIQTGVQILCPGYEEVMLMLSGQFSPISNIRDILITKQDGVKVTIGVLINSMYEFSVILKGNKIPSDLALTDLPFNVTYFDTQVNLLKALAANTVDSVFCVVHPYETAFIDHIRTHETRLVDLYPASKFPLPSARTGVQPIYNPEDTDLMAQFRKTVHDNIDWVFDYTLPVNKQVRLKEPSDGKDIFIMIPGTSIYKTFKIRSLLVCSTKLTDTRVLNQLTTRLVTQSFSINQAINAWNDKYLETQLAIQVANANKSQVSGVVNTRITRATSSKFPHDFQLGNKTSGSLFLYYDYDSFSPDNFGTVPRGLTMEPTMRSVIAKLTNKIKIEYVEACPT